MIVEETYRDYYGIDLTFEGGPYKRQRAEDIALTESFYRKQYKLVDDYLLSRHCTYDNIRDMATRSYLVTVQDHIDVKSPVMSLAYCIKAENIYYLTEFDKSEIQSLLVDSTMYSIVIDVFKNMVMYGHYSPRIILSGTSDIYYETMLSDLQSMKDLLRNMPFIRHFTYDLQDQQIIYNICKEGTIPLNQ